MFKLGGIKWGISFAVVCLAITMVIEAQNVSPTGNEIEKDVIILKLKAKPFGLFEKQNPDLLKNLKPRFVKQICRPQQKITLQSQQSELLKVGLEEGQDMQVVLDALNQSPDVEYAEPIYKVTLFDTPNDPGYPQQTYLNKTSLPQIWNVSVHSEVIVAVVDTGVDYTHEDLIDAIKINQNEIPNNRIDDDHNGYVDDVYGYNFYGASEGKGNSDPMDLHSHGTHLSGIIAAQAYNGIGVVGINPNAKILPVRFLDEKGAGNQVDGAMAIYYAVDQGAKVINCSWGYYKTNKVLEEAIQYANSKGVVVVAAVGNTNSPVVEYPSGCNGVIGVGSALISASKASYSTYGPQVDFMAYGSSIYSTLPGSRYGAKSGTSQAAAVMSGLISRLLSNNPNLSYNAIYEILKQNSQYADKKDIRLGYGLIDAEKIAQQYRGVPTPDDTSINEENSSLSLSEALSIQHLMNYPNPIKTSTTFGFDSNRAGAGVTIDIYTLSGTKIDRLEAVSTAGYNKINWNPGNIYNGTYVYVATIKSDVGTKTIKGKLAILK